MNHDQGDAAPGRVPRALAAVRAAFALVRQRNPVVYWGGICGFAGLAAELVWHTFRML